MPVEGAGTPWGNPAKRPFPDTQKPRETAVPIQWAAQWAVQWARAMGGGSWWGFLTLMFSVVVPADAQQRMQSAGSGRVFSCWAWCVAQRHVNNLVSVFGFLFLVCFKIFAKISGHGRSAGQMPSDGGDRGH